MRRRGEPTGGRQARGPPGGTPLTGSAHASGARFPSRSRCRGFPFRSRQPQADSVVALPPGACVVSDPRGLRRPALCVRPSPHSRFPGRVSVRMRLAPLGSAEPRRGSRASEETSASLGRRPALRDTGIFPEPPSRSGYWKAGRRGLVGWSARPVRGAVAFDRDGFGFHPRCRERGGGRASCRMRDLEAKTGPLSPLKSKSFCDAREDFSGVGGRKTFFPRSRDITRVSSPAPGRGGLRRCLDRRGHLFPLSWRSTA
ncbi:uncharacterized protein LOC124236831 [Equus quagga]|uniref:uncharacterized protein LOC124236831 n=1 Tax=Equus quagga TaxID=89248 RepID=UPI001EE1A4AE|nr:uncharacterized protein LOC124236831 [Equus quagga]